MVTEIWVNIGSGIGLLPDDTKPLPESMLTYPYGPMASTEAIFMRSKDTNQQNNIDCFKLHPDLPGASELEFCKVLSIFSCTFQLCLLKDPPKGHKDSKSHMAVRY